LVFVSSEKKAFPEVMFVNLHFHGAKFTCLVNDFASLEQLIATDTPEL
jgi:hypothetical protein